MPIISVRNNENDRWKTKMWYKVSRWDEVIVWVKAYCGEV